MKQVSKHFNLFIAAMLLTCMTAMAQNVDQTKVPTKEMKTFVIERDITGAGQFSPAQLKSISQTSCSVLTAMGPDIQWVNSYVTDNKIFCVYRATNIELIKEHAKRGGFPANEIYEVSTVISPATAKN